MGEKKYRVFIKTDANGSVVAKRIQILDSEAPLPNERPIELTPEDSDRIKILGMENTRFKNGRIHPKPIVQFFTNKSRAKADGKDMAEVSIKITPPEYSEVDIQVGGQRRPVRNGETFYISWDRIGAVGIKAIDSRVQDTHTMVDFRDPGEFYGKEPLPTPRPTSGRNIGRSN